MTKQFVFQTDTPASTGPTVDFDALTKHVIERVNAADKPKARIGIVSGIVELGLQAQEDAKMKWDGTDEQREEIERKAAAGESQEYFEVVPYGQNNVPTLCKRWPSKPQKEIAVFVDFPSEKVNKGQFFDEEGVGEELPFRALLNGEFFRKDVGRIVGKPYALREYKDEVAPGVWSFKKNTILYKMGEAAGVLDTKGAMKPQYLGKLIGKAFMFNVHVHGEEYQGKTYLKEKISYNGPVPEMMESMIPTLDDKHLFLVNFKGSQDEDAVKNLRQSVINHMTMAQDFATSEVRKTLIAVGKIKETDGNLNPTPEPESRQPAPRVIQQAATPVEPVNFDDFDDDIPF